MPLLLADMCYYGTSCRASSWTPQPRQSPCFQELVSHRPPRCGVAAVLRSAKADEYEKSALHLLPLPAGEGRGEGNTAAGGAGDRALPGARSGGVVPGPASPRQRRVPARPDAGAADLPALLNG